MMNCGYTAGELNTLYYLKETNYGDTVSSGQEGSTVSFIPGPYTTTWQRQDDLHRYRQYLPGSRSYDVNTSVDQGNDVAFSFKGILRSAEGQNDPSGWADPIIRGALGEGNMGITTSDLGVLPSFSILMGLGSSFKNNQFRMLYNGCKINNMTLSADQPKAVIGCQAEIWSQYAERVIGNNVSELQSFVISAEDVPISSRPVAVQWNSAIVLNNEQIYPVSWNLTVNNNLGRTVGPKTGKNQQSRLVTRCLGEGKRDITMSMSCWMSDYHKQIQDQLNNPILGEMIIPISGGKSIRLTGGRYTLSLPEHVQDRHQIEIKTDWTGAEII